jgi:hypothetical protein
MAKSKRVSSSAQMATFVLPKTLCPDSNPLLINLPQHSLE